MKNQKCSRCSRATPAAWYCKKFQCTVADDEMGSCDSYREDDSEPEALDAARRMRFRPGTKAGKAVRTLVLLPFDFNLR